MARRKQTALERYCRSILSGKTVACAKMRKLAERLLADIRNRKGRWVFDPELAERPVRFIEEFCKVPSGRIGRPLMLEDYEKAWIEAIFGFVDRKTKMRRYTEAFICVARKNGKSSLAAAIELYMLIADGEGAPQVINAANNLDQANLSYKAALRIVLQSGDISKHVHKQEDQLYCDLNMGYIKPMAANASTLDGLDVHMAVIDEIHAAKTRDVYDLMKQATAAREQPLIFTITTNGFVRNSVFDAQYDYARRWLDGELDDERFVAFVYELDDRSEWDDESCWMEANPGLGTVKSVEYLRGQVAKAKEDPAYRPTVLTKDFNMPENASVAWLSFEEAVNEETFDLSEMGFRYGICGFDASDTTDLTSAQMLMMRPDDERIYEASMYWLPEETVMAADGRNDRDGAPYRLWIARGLMRTVPGNKVDKRVLLEWLVEMRDEHDVYPYAVCVDPWHMDDSTLRDLEMLVGKGRVLKIRQGALTLSEPMKRIRADYKANRIVDNHNPVNEWCRMNVSVKADVNMNIQPDKKGMNPKNRIDGFAAELDAYVGLQNLMADYLAFC